MYGVLHVDNEAHTVNLVPLKEIDNVPVFVEPLNPYELHGVRFVEFPHGVVFLRPFLCYGRRHARVFVRLLRKARRRTRGRRTTVRLEHGV